MLKNYEKEIFQIMKLFKDESFLKRRLEIYNIKPDMLNPLEMYVIEEIYRLGNNNYFNTLTNIESNDIIKDYNIFMNKCRTDFNYELYKTQEYFKKNSSLNNLEKFCISLILKNKEKRELLDKRSKYEYDELYEIKYSNDEELKESIFNISVSMGINSILKLKDTKIDGIKERQLSKGMFADIDKRYLIDLISSDSSNLKTVEALVHKMYPIAKMMINNTNGEEVLSYLFGTDVNECRTNICANEVFDLGKTKQK